jgi:DNA polymerase-3 subunit delta'
VSVWDDVVGQPHAVGELRTALRAPAHAWLFSGPPGSGRSVAARAFAAALQCPRDGCGECAACHTVLTGTHADVTVVRPEGLSVGVREARELVVAAASAPTVGEWRVVLVEDADRFTEGAANVLLKSIEEPPPRTVWLLCVPSVDDLPPTIRSRCRVVRLGIPSADAVADVLIRRDGADPAIAAFAARAAQGHVGRARRLVRDEDARRRRRDVLDVASAATSVPGCFAAAEALDAAAKEEAEALAAEVDAAETTALREALGATGARAPRGSAGALRELEARQKSRATRTRRDALDRALLDLAALYRDVLVLQLAADVGLVNGDVGDVLARLARGSAPEQTLRRLDAVVACRETIATNVAPQLALEALTLRLLAA